MFLAALFGIMIFFLPDYLLAQKSDPPNSKTGIGLYFSNKRTIQFKSNFSFDYQTWNKYQKSGNASLGSLNSIYQASQIFPIFPGIGSLPGNIKNPEFSLQITTDNNFSFSNTYTIEQESADNNKFPSPIDTVDIQKNPIEFSFFPTADTTLTVGDSIQFSISLKDFTGDSSNFLWFLNDSLMSEANDSLFVFSPISDLAKNDSIRVVFSNEDTMYVHQWNITIVPQEKINFDQLTFSPTTDTTIICGDSMRLRIEPFAEALLYRWFKNENPDTTTFDNSIAFHAPPDSEGIAKISAAIFSEDSSFQQKNEWIIKYIFKAPAPIEFFYYPVSDTSIFEGDSLILGVGSVSSEDSMSNFLWSVNNFSDSSKTKTSFLITTDFFASGTDTVSVSFNIGDSLFTHQWIINIQNKNRPPQILSNTMAFDTTLTLSDTMYYSVETFDPDNDSLFFCWALNGIIDSSATDSFFFYSSKNNFSETDTLQLKISDEDTSIYLDWIIRHAKKNNHPPQIISAFPGLDSILTKTDSVLFKISCFDEDGDSIKFQWSRNNLIDTTATDSFYFYFADEMKNTADSITAFISDNDTSIFARWILFPDSANSVQTIIKEPVYFYPETDSILAANDSLNFRICNLPDSTNIQWFINSQSDSSKTDTSFIYYLSDRENSVDTIRVKIIAQDSSFSHEWYVYYSELPTQYDSLKLAFLPEKETITFSTDDSLKFCVQLKKANLSDINIHWFINHELDESNTDTTFFIIPDVFSTTIDTITVLITHADTTIFFSWAIRYEAVIRLPSPILQFPIEGNRISEFETLLWKNDSSLAAFDSTSGWKYIVQLSKDSTFSEIFSTDTCSALSIPINNLDEFEKISIGEPVYWHVKIFSGENKESEFASSLLPFYYFPTFIILEGFYGEKKQEGIFLSWTTSYEENCAGFNIYRSVTSDGNFEKINDYLITGKTSYSWIDKTSQAGTTLFYKLEELTTNGRKQFHQPISVELPAPVSYSLSHNFPNPFNSSTSFKYQIPKTTYVLIEVFNILGKKVKTLIDERKDAGYYTVYWDGVDENGEYVVSGIYFYIISTEKFHATQKMIVVR